MPQSIDHNDLSDLWQIIMSTYDPGAVSYLYSLNILAAKNNNYGGIYWLIMLTLNTDRQLKENIPNHLASMFSTNQQENDLVVHEMCSGWFLSDQNK